MKADLRVGKKWDCLHIVATGMDVSVQNLDDGIKEKVRDEWFDAKCTCGGKVRIWKRDWRGIRGCRDCGCGSAELLGRTVVLTVSMSMKLKQRVGKFAKDKGYESRSVAVRDLLEVGLETLQ